jgi:hypothetical protein
VRFAALTTASSDNGALEARAMKPGCMSWHLELGRQRKVGREGK